MAKTSIFDESEPVVFEFWATHCLRINTMENKHPHIGSSLDDMMVSYKLGNSTLEAVTSSAQKRVADQQAANPFDVYANTFAARVATSMITFADPQDRTANLITIAKTIHADNVAAGWWTDLHTGESLIGKRNMGELLALVHSEISEGLEGYRKNLQDDKLPHRKMLEVELADAAIRLFDILGSMDDSLSREWMTGLYADFDEWFDFSELVFSPDTNVGQMLSNIHFMISLAHGTHIFDDLMFGLWAAMQAILRVGHALDLDLAGALIEKRAYNKTRADHKPENRLKADGKKI